MSALLEKVKNCIMQQGFFRQGECVLAAVSGGTDSMALLHLLCALAPEAGFRVAAAHIDHNLRESSAQDARFVETYCRERGIPFYCKSVQVKKEGRSPEEAARIARYAALEELRKDAGADCIALAHHKEDQAETLLLHLLRGSGLRGLCGMKYSQGRLRRPLLDISKQEILEYCRENGIPSVTDETNFSTQYLRNRVRWELLPGLREYNPNITETLCRTAKALQADEAYLAEETERAFSACCRQKEDGVFLDTAAFLKLPEALQRRLLRKALETAAGLRDVGFSHIEDGCRLAAGNGRISLPGGIVLEKSGDTMRISRLQGTPERELTGITQPALGKIIAGKAERRQNVSDASLTQYLDASVLEGSVLRTRQPGDRIRPLGACGSKKLKDYLIDRKVPAWERDQIPLLCRGSEVLWAIGVGISEQSKVTPQSTVCRLDYKKTE